MRRREHEDLGVDLGRVHPRRAPELRARCRERVHHHEPLEIRKGLEDLIAVGADGGRGHAREEHALHLSLERLVVDRHPRRVHSGFWDEVVRVLVVLCRLAAVPGLEQADHEVAVVDAEEVPGVWIASLWRVQLNVLIEILLSRRRDPQISRKDLPADRVVGVPLDVRVAALRVHPAAGSAHVAEQELQQRAGTDELPAGRVMGESDGVHDGHDLVGLAHLADDLRDLRELIDRDAGDARDHLRCVARVVLGHELEDRARVLEGHVALGPRRGRSGRTVERCRPLGLVAPRRDVVRPGRGVVSGEETVLEVEAFFHDERGVRVVLDVVLVIELVLDDVVDEAAEVGDVGTGPDPQVHVG